MSLRLPLLPRPVRWLPAALVAGLICYGSILTSSPTTGVLEALSRAATTAGTLSGTADAVTTDAVTTSTTSAVISPLIVPFLGGEISPSYRRHAIAYAALTLALAYAVADREASIARKALVVFAVAMAYGIAMEVGQSFRPERTASLVDVAANAAGAGIALHWYALERRARFVPVREIARTSGPTRGDAS